MYLTLHENQGNNGESPLYIVAEDIITIGYSTERNSTEVRLQGGVVVYITESPTEILNSLRFKIGKKWS